MADILGACLNEPKNKTAVQCDAYLAYSTLKMYLDLLLEKGLLIYDAPLRMYSTSERGRRFLDSFENIATDLPEPHVKRRNIRSQ